MDGRATLFAVGGALALVLGLVTAAVGFYVSAQTQCDAGVPDEATVGTDTPGASGPSGAPDASGGCPGLGTWVAYGGGTTAVVGFFALLYGWVRFVYG
jgi:hypothetical protein